MPYFLPCLRPRWHVHPMIVRINDVGHAEAIDYRNVHYRPQEAENKYITSPAGQNCISAAIVSPSNVIKRSRSTASIATYDAP
jgi:hypothetical protein